MLLSTFSGYLVICSGADIHALQGLTPFQTDLVWQIATQTINVLVNKHLIGPTAV